MTETASTETPPAAPVLLHGGYYELYQTPAGGLQVRYQRTAYTDPEAADVVLIDPGEQVIEYLPEIPAAVADALRSVQETGEPPSLPALMKIMAGGMRTARRRSGGGNG